MASYNRIILVGNLTRNPEISTTPSGTSICKFGLATNRKWRDKEGGDKEEVCFVDCTLFGKGGEAFAKYLTVGNPVLVEGRLVFDQWEAKDGTKRSKHGVIVENFTFLGGVEKKERICSYEVETTTVRRGASRPSADDTRRCDTVLTDQKPGPVGACDTADARSWRAGGVGDDTKYETTWKTPTG